MWFFSFFFFSKKFTVPLCSLYLSYWIILDWNTIYETNNVFYDTYKMREHTYISIKHQKILLLHCWSIHQNGWANSLCWCHFSIRWSSTLTSLLAHLDCSPLLFTLSCRLLTHSSSIPQSFENGIWAKQEECTQPWVCLQMHTIVICSTGSMCCVQTADYKHNLENKSNA